MKIEAFIEKLNSDFFCGVPDSQLKALCDYLMSVYGIDNKHHIIASNEGNCTAIAAGYHLATGKIPVVYMQNSGEGNIINPVASLMNDKVYGIPCIFIVGWRGEPGVKDEPQHIFQGEVTLKLLEDMDIMTFVITKETSENELNEKTAEFERQLKLGKQVAFVIKKGALEFDGKIQYSNSFSVNREEAIKHIASVSGEDVIISTTGKASRELFEIREGNHDSHMRDFLTVGSMGHASSIALGVATQKPDRKVWIIDGDGAALMHLGSMALLGANSPENVVHVVLNNGAHDTVGGMPTVAGKIKFIDIAKACGYSEAVSADSLEQFDEALRKAKASNTLSFIEVKCSLGSRCDLGRPTTTAKENKENFMNFLSD